MTTHTIEHTTPSGKTFTIHFDRIEEEDNIWYDTYLSHNGIMASFRTNNEMNRKCKTIQEIKDWIDKNLNISWF